MPAYVRYSGLDAELEIGALVEAPVSLTVGLDGQCRIGSGSQQPIVARHPKGEFLDRPVADCSTCPR